VWWEPQVFFPLGETVICVKCERGFLEGRPLYFILETDVGLDATSKAPTKHEELFEAACALLRKGISDEDRIVPTLLGTVHEEAPQSATCA
jgi:hypothetical protein